MKTDSMKWHLRVPYSSSVPQNRKRKKSSSSCQSC